MVVRGCGTRVAGGIYLTVATSPYGKPLEDFLVDPPIPISPNAIGLTPVGVRGVEDASGVYHVFDWVGTEHYPHVTDAIEEGRRYGFSRRAEGSGIDYSRISSRSSLVLIHARAAIANVEEFCSKLRFEYGLSGKRPEWDCPARRTWAASAGVQRVLATIERHKPTNPSHTETCLGMHYYDFTPRDLTSENLGQRAFPPKSPQFEYPVWPGPRDFKVQYQVAIFAQLPLGAVEVVRDPNDSARQLSQFEKARVAKIDVRLVDE